MLGGTTGGFHHISSKSHCYEQNSFWSNLSSPRIVGSSSMAKAWIIGSSRYSSVCIWALALDREEEDRATCICPVLVLYFFPESSTCPLFMQCLCTAGVIDGDYSTDESYCDWLQIIPFAVSAHVFLERKEVWISLLYSQSSLQTHSFLFWLLLWMRTEGIYGFELCFLFGRPHKQLILFPVSSGDRTEKCSHPVYKGIVSWTALQYWFNLRRELQLRVLFREETLLQRAFQGRTLI